MSAILNPYLMFNDGLAEEAMTFYQSVFGGDLQIMRFKDTPGMEIADEMLERVMHSALTNGDLNLFGSDAGMGEVSHGSTVTIALSGDDEATLTGWYNALAVGGTVGQPLMKAPWGDSFGSLTDKYGFEWMVNISAAAS